MTLRDAGGAVQCVGDQLNLDLPLPESSVEIIGTVRPHPKRGGEVEVQMQAMTVIAAAAEPTPVELPKLERVHADTLLNHRAVTVRGLKERAALRVQAELLAGFRETLSGMGFTEISTPKIVEAGAEGALASLRWTTSGNPLTWPRARSCTSR
ncbi:amino acid--tRNA ligase-related protein [Deinococcus radiophilus]|uniref:amino acid--tRNA ligase-related protein n=1 Tax=Deinococcus radiophilus TaxID=32062 RepID=UPI00360C0324